MKNIFKRPEHVKPEDLDQQTAAIKAMIEKETPRMNAIAAYLEKRKDQNGFGSDFEYTLTPRRT